jgi:hypothetical protein
VTVADLDFILIHKSTSLIGFWVGDLANCEAKTLNDWQGENSDGQLGPEQECNFSAAGVGGYSFNCKRQRDIHVYKI